MAKQATVEQPGELVVTTPAAMLQSAIASGAGVEVMEKLLALQERWEANQARKAYDAAMARLRAKLPKIIKDRKVSHPGARYKHEDIANIVEAVSPVMAEEGFNFRWRTGSTEKTVTVTCIVTHEEGHSEETTLTGPHDVSGGKNPIQAVGSSTTYLQRYTLKAALGVAAANDDDGQGGSDTNQQPQAKPQGQQAAQQQGPRTHPFTEAHKKLKDAIDAYAKQYGLSEEDVKEKILVPITAFTDKNGVYHGGVDTYARMSEKMAAYALKIFNQRVAEAKTKAAQKAKK